MSQDHRAFSQDVGIFVRLYANILKKSTLFKGFSPLNAEDKNFVHYSFVAQLQMAEISAVR